MTQLAALNIKITGDSGDLKTAIASANGDLNALVAAAKKAGLQVEQTTRTMPKMGQALGGMGGKIGGVSMQLQDMAVQLQSGTSAAVVFAQQGSQIASAFGPVGAVIGALAAVGIPALAFAFGSGGEQVKTFKDSLDNLNTSVETLNETTKIYSAEGLEGLRKKYGEVNAELLRHIELQRQIDMRAAAEAAAETIKSLSSELESFWVDQWNGLKDMFALTTAQTNELEAAMRRAENATNFDDQAAALMEVRNRILEATGGIQNMSSEQLAFYTQVQQSLDAMLQLKNSAAQAGWLSGMISEAQSLGSALWDAVSARVALSDPFAAMGDDERGSQRGQAASAGAFRSQQAVSERNKAASSGGGGGGTSLADQLQSELESLQESLMTQEQLQMESYARQQEILNQALQQRLITQEEYQRLMEQAQATHDFAMTQSVNDGVSQTLSALGQLFQGSKKISAAIALANSWLAFTEVLKDPALPWWQRIPQAAAALASGLQAVQSIKSASASGVGATGGATAGATAGAATGAAPQQNVQTLNFTVQNDPFGFGQNLVRQLAAQLNEAQRNGSTLVRATVT